MRRLLAATLVAAFVGMCGGAAQAGEYRLLHLDGKLVKWGEPDFGSGAALTYAVANRQIKFPDAINCKAIMPVKRMLANSGIAMRVFESELAAAFLAWEQVANIRFKRVENPDEANIVIGAQVEPRGHAFANVAHEEGDESAAIRKISKSLVCFNPKRQWKVGFDGNDKIYDLRFTLIHEIGHAIGLDHEGSGDQMMGFAYHEAFRQPQSGDIAGVSRLYGAALGAPQVAGTDNRKRTLSAGAAWRSPFLSLGRGKTDRDDD